MGFNVGRDGSVGIATQYGLEVPEIESLCRQNFLRPSKQDPRPTQPPMKRVPGLFWG